MHSPPIYLPPTTPIDILHADAVLLIVDKPSGLLSVPGRGEDKADCLITRVQRDYPEARIVHRLDQGTSGLLVLARDAANHRALSVLFAERKVEKRYLALAAGRIQDAEGSIALPLITDWPNRPRQKVDFEIGKPSLTHYRVLGYDSEFDASRVELRPETGRSHQLRVHLAALGHPILGDDLYAPEPVRSRVGRLMLHAAELAFTHPQHGQTLHFLSEAPF